MQYRLPLARHAIKNQMQALITEKRKPKPTRLRPKGLWRVKWRFPENPQESTDADAEKRLE